jgi:hypothetical protein
VPLDGLNVVALAYFEGNIWKEGTKATMGVLIDERADQRQRHALQTIFGGQAGGWPGEFMEAAVGEFRGVEYAPVDIRVADDLGHWTCDVPGEGRGPGRPHYAPGRARAGPQPRRVGGGRRRGHRRDRHGGRGRRPRLPLLLARALE